jgi:hypothetical protein
MKTILTLLALALVASSAQCQLLPQTPLERNLSNVSKAADATVAYGRLWAQSLTAAHAAVWSLETSELEQMLNHIGIEGVTRLVGLQTATAQGINQALAAAGDPYRVPETPGREFTVNPQTGYITVTPLPEPEQEEAPSEE